MRAHGEQSVPFGGDLWDGGVKTFMHKVPAEGGEAFSSARKLSNTNSLRESNLGQSVQVGYRLARFASQADA